MLEIENVEFQIQGIELVESSFKFSEQRGGNDVFRFNINLEHLFNGDKDVLIVKTEINILDESSTEVVGNIKTHVAFNILNLAKYFKDNKPNLPEVFVSTLNSISISTTRGMMFSAFRGTFLHNAILPLIDPTFKKQPKNSK
jgi:hypothetical protein